MAILFFWRGDHYRDDTDGGRPTGPLTLQQNAKAFAALMPGDRVWAFTTREDRTYVLAAQARVARVKETPGARNYGRFEMDATPNSTVWYDVAHGAYVEPLIRRLGLNLGSGVLGRSFRGLAAVKQLTNAADAQLERFASGLPIVGQRVPQASGPTQDAVLNAIAEYDRLGQKAFLKQHGYWKAKEYVLVYKGKRYDSKAIYGVARGWRAQDFSGGDLTVRPWLEPPPSSSPPRRRHRAAPTISGRMRREYNITFRTSTTTWFSLASLSYTTAAFGGRVESTASPSTSA